MKQVVIIPQYESLSFRVIGTFDNPISAHSWVDDNFQDIEYKVIPYNPVRHDELIENVEEI